MIMTESKGDLFQLDSSYVLVHCISKDCKMGAGIADQFRKKYPAMKPYCLSQAPAVGKAIYYDPKSGANPVFNLVTKTVYYSRPTYETLERALSDLKRQCLAMGVEKLGMPQLGCGLDRLNWTRVRAIIRKTFQDTDMEIAVRSK